jgi:hypothetical protein
LVTVVAGQMLMLVPARIRVLLADDQALVRAGFRALLDTQDGIETASSKTATLSGMDGGMTTVAGLNQAAAPLGGARRIVVFTGAGVSTDSRIIL